MYPVITRPFVSLTIAVLFAIGSALGFSQSPGDCPMPGQNPVSVAASDYIRTVNSPARAEVITAFYEPCNFALAWTKEGLPTAQAKSLIAQLADAAAKGLHPADYGVPGWGSRACALEVTCKDSAVELARFDVDLTAAVIRYVSDLTYGRAAPQDARAGYIVRPELHFIADLVRRELVNSQDVPANVQGLEPQAPGYSRTEHALTHLLTTMRDADVPVNPGQKALHSGESSPGVVQLVNRLKQLGYVGETDTPTLTYQEPIVSAVERFQSTHGITPTGVVDAKTWQELAVPQQKRAAQLALTLERWRWVPHTFEEPPVVVNIPEFWVRAYDEQLHVVLPMPVIVGGSAGRRSPVLQANMTEVIFHPFWNIPPKIQRLEIAPHLARNPSYLSANGLQLIDSHGMVVHLQGSSALRAVLSGSVRVRQLPGDQNALGAIKFVFPNAFDVYMHGTPEQRLFQNARRDFSHGCIRVENPAALALWVLRHESGWTAEQISAAVANPKTRSVRLSRPIPVLIVYGTGFAAEDGSIRFLDDIYGYDASLSETLRKLSSSRRATDQVPW